MDSAQRAHWHFVGPTTLGGKIELRLDYPQNGKMQLYTGSSVTVPEATVRFPIPAGSKLTSVNVNRSAVTSFSADSVVLKNVTGPTGIEVEF